MKKDLMEKVDKIDLLISEVNLNLLAKKDQIDSQELERINLLALKENQVLQKKIKQNHQALQIIRSILEKNLQKTPLKRMKKKALDLKARKNLKAEIVGLKILALKNTVKKELNLKTF